jgi:hypothetical protein
LVEIYPSPTIPCKMVTIAIPSVFELQDIFFNEQACIEFLRQHGALFSTIVCCCGHTLTLNSSRRTIRCTARECRKEYSQFYGSYFAKTILPTHKILFLAHFWLTGGTTTSAIKFFRFSSRTVCAQYGWFRQLIADSLDENDMMVGGDGVIVEIDESKFGKRKFHRGHHVEGVWVLGGVKRTKERRVFLVAVPDWYPYRTYENSLTPKIV